MTTKIVLNSAGIQALLKSLEIQNELSRVADSRISKATGNYKKSIEVQSTRAAVKIRPKDHKTYKKNLKNNEMVKMVK